MKRVISFLCLLIMFLTCFSIPSFAADGFGLKVSEVTDSSVTLVWDESTNARRYYVYRSTFSDSGFQKIACVSAGKYIDKSLSENTVYYYKVRSFTGSLFMSYSDFSETVEAVTEKKIVFKLNKEYIKVGVGETYQLKATNGAKAVFSSDNTSVATVSADGKVKALKKGVAIITAKHNGVAVQCEVDVRNEPKKISLGRKTLTLGVGETYKFDISSDSGSASYNNKYKSSNTSVATINSSRVITAKKPGKTTVTMTSYNGLKTTCVVTVKNAPESVSLNKKSATIFIGGSVDLDSYVNDGAGSYLKKYTSSNPSVAKVGAKGVITGVSNGTSTITVKTYNGKTATCKITVKIVNYKKAYTAAQVRNDVKALSETYSSLIKTDVIGQSVKGSPIPLIKLGRGDKEALIVAGIHSREYLTIGFTMRCVEEYAAAYYSKTGKLGNYDIVSMLDEYTLYIVPMSNPDGLDIVTNGKKTLYDKSKKDETYKRNANGVNLNRNFPFCWDKVTDGSSTKYENYKGKYAASEPETQALMALCNAHDFEWLYSMHLYGNNVYWRDSKNGVVPGDEALVKKLNKVCGFVISPSTTDPNGYGGGFENWFRATYNKPGFCVELVPLNQNYRYEISRTSQFDTLTNWSKTKYAFIQGMI